MAVLVVSLLAVASGVVVFTRREPLPERLALFHFEMCEPPCWIGITPGVTTLDEAVDRARQVYGKQGYRVMSEQLAKAQTDLGIDNGDQLLFPGGISLYTENGKTINRIQLWFSQYHPGLENHSGLDAFRWFGHPTHIRFWSQTVYDSNAPVLVYSQKSVDINLRQEIGIDLLQREIQAINFYEEPRSIEANVNWKGFRSIDRYYTEWLSLNP